MYNASPKKAAMMQFCVHLLQLASCGCSFAQHADTDRYQHLPAWQVSCVLSTLCAPNEVYLVLHRADFVSLRERGGRCSVQGLSPAQLTVRATIMCCCLCVLWVYTCQVQLASEVGTKPLGKYTAKGPTVVPSASLTGCMCTTSGRASRFLLTITLSDLTHKACNKAVSA